MPRNANRDWNLPDTLNWDHVSVAVLMDIRDELKTLNRLLHCQNFTNIPSKLDDIRRNTTRRRRRKSK